LQSTPQLIPAGLLVTVPVPVPALTTLRVYEFKLNMAVTVVAAVIVTVQPPVPEQPPPVHPANVELTAGEAVRLTIVPWENPSVQSTPQLMPTGLLATVPVPKPAFATVRV
jgi:hypothetical protein